MDDDIQRGEALKARRLAHDMSLHELNRATGINRTTLGRVEDGTASDRSFERLEAFFDKLDARLQEDGSEPAVATSPEGRYIEFTVHGLYGARDVTVKGPVEDMAEIEQMVQRLLRGQTEDPA